VKDEDQVEGYLVKPLYDALMQKADYFKRIEEFGGSQFEGKVAILADESVAYETVFKVLYTAGRAEFGLFKLFVQKPPS
jgi:biopolymer transport protein ExbD